MTNLPEPSARFVEADGRINQTWYSALRSLVRLADSVNNTATGLGTSKASTSQTFAEALLIETASDKAYPFVGLAIEGTITEVVTQCASGSCTVTVSINGTDLGGGASSVTTAKDIIKHGDRNTLRDGDDVTVTISSNSSATDVSVTLRGTRTLA